MWACDAGRGAVRLACAAVAQHPLFETLILGCIFVTTITVWLEMKLRGMQSTALSQRAGSVQLLLERPDDGTVAAACPTAPAFLNCSGYTRSPPARAAWLVGR